jgi:hypothetical protein
MVAQYIFGKEDKDCLQKGKDQFSKVFKMDVSKSSNLSGEKKEKYLLLCSAFNNNITKQIENNFSFREITTANNILININFKR